MSNRRTRGFTLVEMIIAMVIIGVGLAGVLMAFSTTVKSSADPMIRKQMLAVAEEMMEEILLKPYAPNATGSIAAESCDRTNADDIGDYAIPYSTPQRVCAVDGTEITELAGYTVAVEVVSPATLGTLAADPDVTQITVTVTGSGETLSLVGWRTNYGGTP